MQRISSAILDPFRNARRPSKHAVSARNTSLVATNSQMSFMLPEALRLYRLWMLATSLPTISATSTRNPALELTASQTPIWPKNSSCVLQPDVTAGPYLVTAEAERSNVTNGEEGVPLTLLVQIIDTATCKPAPGLYVDMWQANSTGVYSGVMVNGNGNSKDATNLKNTAFRGFQQTDSVGVVRFYTVFPGHYTGNYPCYISPNYSTANREHRPCKPHPYPDTQP